MTDPRSSATVLVTDMDNTLFDWLGMWHAAFGKPDASVLRDILGDVGAEPGEAVYVGDSLVKDVAMAQAAGVVDVFARYGDVRSRPGDDLLRRVTHWSPAMLARSERIREADVHPTRVLGDGFAELLGHVEFRRFTAIGRPRRR